MVPKHVPFTHTHRQTQINMTAIISETTAFRSFFFLPFSSSSHFALVDIIALGEPVHMAHTIYYQKLIGCDK